MSEFDAIPSATITADLGQGVVEQAVTSWSIDRTLSGGGLPGQARAASGSSVGSGSVSVESDATPWNAGAIKPAGRVTVSASEDVGVAASRVGAMVVRSVGAPSALSSQRDLSIEDDLGGLRGQVVVPVSLPILAAWSPDAPVVQRGPMGLDASWAILLAARAGGFHASTPPAPGTVLDLPMQGSVGALIGSSLAAVDVDPQYRWTGGWGTSASGQTVLVSESNTLSLEARFATPLATTGDIFIAFTVARRRSTGIPLTLQASDANRSAVIGFDAPAGVDTAALHVGINAANPDILFDVAPATGRVVIQVQRISTTSVRARARSAATQPWSAWSIGEAIGYDETVDSLAVRQSNSRPTVHAIVVATQDSPQLYATPTARIAASGSPLDAIVIPRTASAWSMTQEIAAATLGAVWIDEDGVLVYRSREQLRGSGVPTETVYSLDKLDDVPWEVSTDDVADRAEVTYSPPAVTVATTYWPTVWQSTEVVTIPAGQTVTIEHDIDGAADDLAPWYPAWNSTFAPVTRYSRWAASTLPGGGGPQPADDALQITAEMVNPSKVRIRIRNTTTGTLYTAGTDGTTLLTLRANVVARPSEPLTLSTGLPADRAIAPLSIDLGSWVQDQDTAQEILSWLTGTLSQPLPILRQVGVTPKASRRLGDVIVIRDPYTELASKALITGIHSSGEAGRYSQSLDLAILAAIEADVARRWLQVTDTEGDLAQYIFAQLGATATEADVARWIQTEAIA